MPGRPARRLRQPPPCTAAGPPPLPTGPPNPQLSPPRPWPPAAPPLDTDPVSSPLADGTLRVSPVLPKPRRTAAWRPGHPRGRGARVTTGGPPGPSCASRAGGEAARLPSAARRARALLFPGPLGFPSPRLGPPPPCPTPGRRGAGRAKGPWPLRCALSPPRACSWRRVPGGRAPRTPEGRKAGRSARKSGDPGARGGGRVRAARCSTQSAHRALCPAALGSVFLPFRAARRSGVRSPPLPGHAWKPQRGLEPPAPRQHPPAAPWLQPESRGHALPPPLRPLAARLSLPCPVLLPEGGNCSGPAQGACRGRARAGNCGGRLWVPAAERGGDLGRGQEAEARRRGRWCVPIQKGREGGQALWLPGGIRRGKKWEGVR